MEHSFKNLPDNMESDYACRLNEGTLLKAKLELNEDAERRDKALKSFRDWISRQGDWLKTPTDTTFLLAFLRKCKFSLIVAQERLVRYWVDRGTYPQYFRDVDFQDHKLARIMKTGWVYVLPKTDKHGRKVVMFRVDKLAKDALDNPTYTAADAMKVNLALYDLCLMDEAFQVNGLVWISVDTDLQLSHFGYVAEDATANIGCATNSYPMRVGRQCHFVQSNPEIRGVLLQMFARADDEIKQTIVLHDSWESVYEDIGKSILPKEYLPQDHMGEHGGTEEEIIDYNLQTMLRPDIAAWLARLSCGEYGVDESKRPGVLAGMIQMASTIMNASMKK